MELYVTKKSVERGTLAIVVKGLPKWEQGTMEKVNVPLGKEMVQLVRGDTHLLWRQHQDEAGQKVWDKLYKSLAEKAE